MSEPVGQPPAPSPLETALLNLLKGEHSSLTLSFNDQNAPNYQTVQQWLIEDHVSNEWVSQEERERAIATNRMWTLHWYPDTPIGFYAISASSLSVLLAHVLGDALPSSESQRDSERLTWFEKHAAVLALSPGDPAQQWYLQVAMTGAPYRAANPREAIDAAQSDASRASQEGSTP